MPDRDIEHDDEDDFFDMSAAYRVVGAGSAMVIAAHRETGERLYIPVIPSSEFEASGNAK